MSGLPRLGVVHAPHAAASIRDLVRAAKGRCELVLLVRPEVAGANPALLQLAGALAETHVADRGSGLRLDGLTTFHDAELEYTDAMLHELDLPGAPPIGAPWDKLVQRQRFCAEGVSKVQAAAVDRAADLAGAVAEVGLPAVLKPRRSMGSVGLSFLLDDADVLGELGHRTRWEGLMAEAMIPRSQHPSEVAWLADYVSVETLTGPDGVHRHVAVFDKLPLSIAAQRSAVSTRETGDVLPSRLPAPVRDAALATVSAALDALGVRSRVSHTELRVCPSGVDIIEVNGRLGGEVEQMLQLLGGAGMVAAAFDLALGAPAPTAPAPRLGFVACVYVPFGQREGQVRSAVAPVELRRASGVVRVDELARQGEQRAATGYRAAKLTLQAPTEAQLQAALGGVLDLVAGLFAADGLDTDPWLSAMRAATRIGGQ